MYVSGFFLQTNALNIGLIALQASMLYVGAWEEVVEPWQHCPQQCVNPVELSSVRPSLMLRAAVDLRRVRIILLFP